MRALSYSPGAGYSARRMTESPKKPKNYFVKSFGCQMNVYDSERMAELLAAEGMAAATDAESADPVVLNTCHIREKAAEKVYSDIGRMKKIGRASGRERVGQECEV